MPDISVIIPLYNGESTIRKVLDSLMTQQMPAGVEVLVINDCSTDGSRDVVNHDGGMRRC